MIDLKQTKVGDKVFYNPLFNDDNYQNGMVKEIRDNENHDGIWVVYHCDDNWDNFQNYTGELTYIKDLHPGWVNEVNQEKNNEY